MDFAYSKKVEDLRARLLSFMEEHIYPNEQIFYEEIASNRKNGNAWIPTQIIEDLKPKVLALLAANDLNKDEKLKNLCQFLSDSISYYNWVGFYFANIQLY